MKKVIGQTVRDLKREVNKKVLKVPGIEQKILDATSNEAWGPHGSLLADLAQASRNYHEYQKIMNVIWKRINDTGKNWRHVYKALTVLEYLVIHGSERVIDEIREHAHQISTLSSFQYIDSSGRDQGSNIRRKSQILVALVNDKERIQEVRQKADANKDKYHNTVSAGGNRYDEDHPEGRYGYRDDDRNGHERERDYGYINGDRYDRGRESYNREGDRYGRDHEEPNGRDGYRNDDYEGRGTDGFQFGSRTSVDRYTDHSVDDEDRYSSRSGGGRADDHSHDERRFEQHLSDENVGAPPSYEESIKDAQNNTPNERDGESVTSPKNRSASHAAPEASSPTKRTSPGAVQVVSSELSAELSKEVDSFDEFDPRGSVSAAVPSASSPEFDFFGSLSEPDSTNALSTTTTEIVMPTDSGFGMDFGAPSMTLNNENPFGDPPFKATPQLNSQAQPQNFPNVHSVQPSFSIGSAEPFGPVAPNTETFSGFDLGDMLGGLSYTHAGSSQHSYATSAFSAPEMQVAPASSDILDGILPRTDFATSISSQTAQHAAPSDIHTAQMNSLPDSRLEDTFPPQADPLSSQASQPEGPNNIQSAHLNFLQERVPVSASLQSQTAPVSSEAAQPATPNNMQSAHLGFLHQGVSASDSLQSQTAPISSPATEPATSTNMQSAHLDFLHQGVSASDLLQSQIAPVSSQVAQPATPSNMQSSNQNFLQQGVSTSVSLPSQEALLPSQVAQSAAASNMQTAQFDFFQQPPEKSTPASFSLATSNSLQSPQPAAPPNMQLDHLSMFQQPAVSASTPLPSLPAQLPSQAAAPVAIQSTQLNPQQQTGLSTSPTPQAVVVTASFGPPAKTQLTKFEPKSTVWTDTLNRGLVDLNISGPKTNPLADIGIDFDSINRKEKRKEAKNTAAPVTSTITMGKAMGSGSGFGRAGASGLVPPPNPMTGSGMGMRGMGGVVDMGMGGGAHMGMGAGMGMGGYAGGMNQPSMGMNMGMGQGGQMRPHTGMPPVSPGMPGMGYNPMMAMGNYGSQQPYGGGPPQQPFGGGGFR